MPHMQCNLLQNSTNFTQNYKPDLSLIRSSMFNQNDQFHYTCRFCPHMLRDMANDTDEGHQ